MNKYIVPEDRLLELLEAEARLGCLDQDGVDNWTWHMEGRTRFIADALDISEEEVEERELGFEDVAQAGLYDFQKF